MEFVDGETLAKLLYSGQEIPWQTRLAMAEEIVEGIKCLHLHEPLVCAWTRSLAITHNNPML